MLGLQSESGESDQSMFISTYPIHIFDFMVFKENEMNEEPAEASRAWQTGRDRKKTKCPAHLGLKETDIYVYF